MKMSRPLVPPTAEEVRQHNLSPDDSIADLIAAVDLNPHEATVLVDGRPVPEDAPVETDEVRVLRLIKGG